MLKFFKKILECLLKFLATRALKRYHPLVIAITGSVGKTTTKDAVYQVVKTTGLVWRSELNYNNEIGVPLTILGLKPSSSLFIWIGNLIKGLWLGFGVKTTKYPEKLVLELGADKPGDLEYLTGFIKPDIAIVTKVSPVHAEFFGDLEITAKEKRKIIENLKKDGAAILNYDDKRVRQMGELLPQNKVIYYGVNDSVSVRGFDVKTGAGGTSFQFSYEGKSYSVKLPQIIGEHFVYSALAAISTGIFLGLDFQTIITELAELQPAPHRLQLLKGIQGTAIIDDTYNASAPSMLEALKVLGKIAGNFRVAVLGDMLELGDYTEGEHRKVGKRAAEVANLLIVVGEYARFIGDEAIKSGLPRDKVIAVKNAEEAEKALREHLQEKDVVLVKGSHAVGLEKIVDDITKD